MLYGGIERMEAIMQYIKRKTTPLFKSEFAKGVLIISSGSIMAQAFSFIFSPLITRIFPPTEYGIMSIFASIVAILSMISTLKFEMAIPIAEEKNKAMNLLVLCVINIFIFSTGLVLIFLATGNSLLDLLNARELYDYKLFLILGIFLFSLREVFMQWYYRKKDFTFISKSSVAQSLVGNISKIVFGLLGFGPIGLIIGQIIKESFSVLPFSYKFFKQNKLKGAISFSQLKWNFMRYKDYPIYQTPSSFLAVLKNQFPVFSLAFYGSSVVGLYGLSNTVVKIPMTLLGHSIRNVFFAEAASIGKKNPLKLRELSNKIFKKLVFLGLIPLLVLIIFGPILFELVFGSEWIQAGSFSRFLALSVYGDFIFSPVSRVYEVLERQNYKLLIDIFGFVLVIASFLISRIVSPDPNVAILLYSVSVFIHYFIMFIVSRVLLNREIDKL